MKQSHTTSLIQKISIIALALSLSTVGVRAADFVFDLTNVGSTPADVKVKAEQWDAETLRFTIDQDNPDAFGDLNALLFHVNESIIDVNDLNFSFVAAVENITNASITPSLATSYNVGNYDGFTNYDVLVEFGEKGIGGSKGDIKSVTFDVTTDFGDHSLDLFTFMPIHMEKFMAARVTSTWDGKDREGSSKLVCCGTAVPEPSSTLGLLAFALGGLVWRRRLSA